tara:strand:- start:955 stop:1569 length:615 start_codon:yes stop_codon:yes gene_type:complete
MSQLIFGTPVQKASSVVFVPMKMVALSHRSEEEEFKINPPPLPIEYFSRNLYSDEAKYNLIMKCNNINFKRFMMNIDHTIKSWISGHGKELLEENSNRLCDMRQYTYKGPLKLDNNTGERYADDDAKLYVSVDENTEIIVENGEKSYTIEENFKRTDCVSCVLICDGIYIVNKKTCSMKLRAEKCVVTKENYRYSYNFVDSDSD